MKSFGILFKNGVSRCDTVFSSFLAHYNCIVLHKKVMNLGKSKIHDFFFVDYFFIMTGPVFVK